MSKTTVAIDSDSVKFNAVVSDEEGDRKTARISFDGNFDYKDLIGMGADFFDIVKGMLTIVGPLTPEPIVEPPPPPRDALSMLENNLTRAMKALASYHENEMVYIRDSLVDALVMAGMTVLADDLQIHERACAAHGPHPYPDCADCERLMRKE